MFLPRVGYILRSEKALLPFESEKTGALYFNAFFNKITKKWELTEENDKARLKCLVAREQKQIMRERETRAVRIINIAKDKRSVICKGELE